MATSSRLVILPAVVLLLGGCALLGAPGPTGSPSDGATESSSPSPSPTEPGETDAPNTPLSIACTALVSDQAIYDWGNGNWAADPDFTAPSGSSAATIEGYAGTACGWINLTSNEKLYVAAANLTDDQRVEVEATLKSTGSAVATYGGTGYFGVGNGTGQADTLIDSVWISARSTWFLEAGDASDIMSAAVGAVG